MVRRLTRSEARRIAIAAQGVASPGRLAGELVEMAAWLGLGEVAVGHRGNLAAVLRNST